MRRITVNKPFEYRFPSGAVVVFRQRDTGEHSVKDEVAEHAISRGAATEGWAEDSTTKSRKGNGTKAARARKAKPSTTEAAKPATRARRAANVEIDATAARLQPPARLDGEDLADDDRADDSDATDSVAS